MENRFLTLGLFFIFLIVISSYAYAVDYYAEVTDKDTGKHCGDFDNVCDACTKSSYFDSWFDGTNFSSGGSELVLSSGYYLITVNITHVSAYGDCSGGNSWYCSLGSDNCGGCPDSPLPVCYVKGYLEYGIVYNGAYHSFTDGSSLFLGDDYGYPGTDGYAYQVHNDFDTETKCIHVTSNTKVGFKVRYRLEGWAKEVDDGNDEYIRGHIDTIYAKLNFTEVRCCYDYDCDTDEFCNQTTHTCQQVRVCTDECTFSGTRCVDDNTVEKCENTDGDGCKEYSSWDCAGGGCCYGGTCYTNGACLGTQICSSGSWINHCGDGICNCGEDSSTCPSDCGGGEIPEGAIRVFVTSTTYTGKLGGLSGADAKCQARADAAGLGGTWVAWLSDSTTNAKDRIPDTNVGYYRLDGVKVADNKADLTDGNIDNPINVNEEGTSYSSGIVRTGTKSDGTVDTYTCNDWTTDSSTSYGGIGDITKTDNRWTDYWPDFYTANCLHWRALYCFENHIPSIDSVTDSPDPTAPGETITITVDWFDYDINDVKICVCKSEAFDEVVEIFREIYIPIPRRRHRGWE